MIEIEVSDYYNVKARVMAKEMGTLNNSITKGEGNIAGFIGEFLVRDYLDGIIAHTYDFDVVANHQSYDVKTKRCTSPPKPYYDCSIAAFNTKQKCDKYIFVRILCKDNRYVKAWILGEYDKEKYFKDARFLKKGQRDGDNGFVVKADCYNMAISKLNKPVKKLNIDA